MSAFPQRRLRRLRRTGTLRELTRETRFSATDLVYPLFVRAGEGVREPIASMPGQARYSPDSLLEEADAAYREGIRAILLFGLPEDKDALGSAADSEEGVVQRTVRLLRRELPELVVITDVCLCAYTDHGHCGIVRGGEVANDETLERLASQAVSHVAAGADIVAPSDMMDGRVAAIRSALDGAGHVHAAILSYAAKYASSFYGPFREAVDSAPSFGDRRGYQMDPGNVEEAVHEVSLDISEGADIVMVKPALPYLDVLARVKREFRIPTAAYQVSGEYAMIQAAAERGWLDGEAVMEESAQAIRRAGADLIVTYAARQLARRLSAGS